MLDEILSSKKSSVNKCRGSGASETYTVRWIAYYYALKCDLPDQTAIIQAGTNKKAALGFSVRLKRLLDKIPEVYAVRPKGVKPDEYELNTGGIIKYMPANASAPRGLENIADVVQEEVAWWDLTDDVEVYNAVQSLYAKSHARITHLTTPHGKRGIYYDVVWGQEKSTFKKILVNWREVCGLPVRDTGSLLPYYPLTRKDMDALRRECVYNWKHDTDGYRAWYRKTIGPEKKVPIQRIINLDDYVIDPNAVLEDYRDKRATYDQEYDNQFIASEYSVFGDFDETEELIAWDMDKALAKYNVPGMPRSKLAEDLRGDAW
ncbi:MAG: hypothetical protein K8823_1565 [Cenarchaeum symbiont of Oopsacas minuta]|nr:hypothetical protein [Cenarchaeum symbiont of Oopsacas minuta]